MGNFKLLPCPFCGAIPKIRWEPWKDISETAGVYVLEANHKVGCFIVQMNGTNYKGRMSAFNDDVLKKAWNTRYGGTDK